MNLHVKVFLFSLIKKTAAVIELRNTFVVLSSINLSCRKFVNLDNFTMKYREVYKHIRLLKHCVWVLRR